ncbi:hypothetical protein Dacet_1206 [Denitrovibrio acetiphilus DSM 12809]|uniref:FecR protein domain-containing protein n=1 Tax=Denitrovibrio acetiphilus (strain DSM 12809 / NBRC 114555 / N2460) TaxID=522772 RepID=D4H7H9_DENA2|nr:FecR domain-containing protein [Denitrovibrio acetiphilus]ADD67978.1 hypothetical protein Dacet_1206 [Denitrovibrio acetiphilus DSM 12809]
MKKLIIILIFMVSSISVYGAEKAGIIENFEGRVQIYDGTSPRPENVTETKTEIYEHNRVATKREATALLKFINEDKIALAENSVLTVESTNTYAPEAGRVVFSIKTRGKTSGVNISLTTAVIGVKGTKFVVDTSETGRNAIFLKEGELEVTSKEGNFKKYSEVQIDEYEAYVKKMMGEYDQYVKDLQENFVEYVHNFKMKAGSAFAIDGSEVHEIKFNKDIEQAFYLLNDVE